jgi:hypothetical protein
MTIVNYDRSKSLIELEPVDITGPNYGSSLARTCEHLYRKPLSKFTVEDLRIMIGQNIGLEYLMPLAVEQLENNPFSEGDYYPGDLLWSVLRVKTDFWSKHRDLYSRVYEITNGLRQVLEKLNGAIETFQQVRQPNQ